MTFSITHRTGAVEPGGPEADFDVLLGELDGADEEHPDVALTHESGWCLSAFASGRVVWENIEEGGPPRHTATDRRRIVEMFAALAAGDLATLEAIAWEAGY